jgi:hypothetical protein
MSQNETALVRKLKENGLQLQMRAKKEKRRKGYDHFTKDQTESEEYSKWPTVEREKEREKEENSEFSFVESRVLGLYRIMSEGFEFHQRATLPMKKRTMKSCLTASATDLFSR